tara:strand:+ start:229 stop:525 length:297 start_codon:yes stop_codon:yes gene_type:complete
MAMKIKAEHLEYLKQEIKIFTDREGMSNLVREYETGDFCRSDKVKDLQRRFCFDLFYYAGLSKWACDTLYQYLDDTHLYTALRAILPTVTRKYISIGE